MKLYGWEKKFNDKIEKIYQEENRLEDEMQYNMRDRIIGMIEMLLRHSI